MTLDRHFAITGRPSERRRVNPGRLSTAAARLIERQTFDELLRMVIEAGGDTDTNASMLGQIPGARVGAASISRKIVELLPETTYIENMASDFANALRV